MARATTAPQNTGAAIPSAQNIKLVTAPCRMEVRGAALSLL